MSFQSKYLQCASKCSWLLLIIHTTEVCRHARYSAVTLRDILEAHFKDSPLSRPFGAGNPMAGQGVLSARAWTSTASPVAMTHPCLCSCSYPRGSTVSWEKNSLPVRAAHSSKLDKRDIHDKYQGYGVGVYRSPQFSTVGVNSIKYDWLRLRPGVSNYYATLNNY